MCFARSSLHCDFVDSARAATSGEAIRQMSANILTDTNSRPSQSGGYHYMEKMSTVEHIKSEIKRLYETNPNIHIN
ncbi:MAG: hypothetical protein J6B72_06210 [Clostridia bacterium]|nr:hypothetical protein [Clostridia bacterium]